MAFIADSVKDAGVDYFVTNFDRIDICSSEPATYAAAVGAASLGNKTGLTAVKGDGATDGRQAQVPAIIDGAVTATNTATHWAATDGVGELLATGALTASQAVTSGNTFTLDAILVTIRDATAV